MDLLCSRSITLCSAGRPARVKFIPSFQRTKSLTRVAEAAQKVDQKMWNAGQNKKQSQFPDLPGDRSLLTTYSRLELLCVS